MSRSFSCIGACFKSNVLENVAWEISFRHKHEGVFSKYFKKLKGPTFYYQNFPDPTILWCGKTLEEVWRFALEKWKFFIKHLTKVALKSENWKHQKRRSSIFNGPFVIKQKFSLPEFATVMFSFTCIRQINKRKCFSLSLSVKKYSVF